MIVQSPPSCQPGQAVSVADKSCLNCGAALHGPVCAQCGQREARPIEAGRIVGDAWSQILELDFRIVRTVRDLIVRPGAMVAGYLAGKRESYTNPFKLLFVAGTLYFVVVQALDIRLDLSESAQDRGRTVAAFIHYLIFAILLPTALVMRWVYRPMNWAEHYVSLCYLWGGYFIVAAAVAPVTTAIGVDYVPVRSAIGVVYLAVALRQLHGGGWPVTVLKTLAVIVGYFVSTMLVVGVVVAVAHLVEFEPLAFSLPRG